MTRVSAGRHSSMSDLEAELLWQIKAAGLPEVEMEYRFAPPRRWRFDFSWPDRMVACEVEGATWSGGRHTRGSGFEADAEKYAEAALAGWLVLRVTGGMVKDGRAIALLERALAPRKEVAQ